LRRQVEVRTFPFYDTYATPLFLSFTHAARLAMKRKSPDNIPRRSCCKYNGVFCCELSTAPRGFSSALLGSQRFCGDAPRFCVLRRFIAGLRRFTADLCGDSPRICGDLPRICGDSPRICGDLEVGGWSGWSMEQPTCANRGPPDRGNWMDLGRMAVWLHPAVLIEGRSD